MSLFFVLCRKLSTMLLAFLGPWQIGLLFWILILPFWIFGWVHMLRRPYTSNQKILYSVLFVLLYWIGTVIYFVSRDKSVSKA